MDDNGHKIAIEIAGYLTAPQIAGCLPIPGILHNEHKKWLTLENKKKRKQQIYLESLAKTGIIKLAMKKADINSRQTLANYRMYDPEFAELEAEAITKWKADMDDAAISGLSLELKAKKKWAIKFWLERRHPDFKPKASLSLDNSGEIENQRNSLLELERQVLSQLKQNNHVETTITQIAGADQNASA